MSVLRIPPNEAEKLLQAATAAGETLLAGIQAVGDSADLQVQQGNRRTWVEQIETLLRFQVFADAEWAEKFLRVGRTRSISMEPTLQERVQYLGSEVVEKIRWLGSTRTQLPVLPFVAATEETEPAPGSGPPSDPTAFLVHGHDTGLQQGVARYVQNLGIKVVILEEQANMGRELLQKLRDHSNVHYAIVLLTGDDEGRPRADESADLRLRARQNVVMELGFFIAKLGPAAVCVMHGNGVEMPSDIAGVVYVPVGDTSGSWKHLLGRELKARFPIIDLNKSK